MIPTHAKVRFIPGKKVEVVELDSIKQFRKKIPENIRDYDQDFIYELFTGDNENARPVQISSLAVIENNEELQEFINKRTILKPLNHSAIQRYGEKKESPSDNADFQEEKDQSDLSSSSEGTNVEEENVMPKHKERNKLDKEKQKKADAKLDAISKTILEARRNKMKESTTLQLQGDVEPGGLDINQNNKSESISDNYKIMYESLQKDYKSLFEDCRKLKIKYDALVGEHDTLHKNHIKCEAKCEVLFNLNIQLQEKVLGTEVRNISKIAQHDGKEMSKCDEADFGSNIFTSTTNIVQPSQLQKVTGCVLDKGVRNDHNMCKNNGDNEVIASDDTNFDSEDIFQSTPKAVQSSPIQVDSENNSPGMINSGFAELEFSHITNECDEQRKEAGTPTRKQKQEQSDNLVKKQLFPANKNYKRREKAHGSSHTQNQQKSDSPRPSHLTDDSAESPELLMKNRKRIRSTLGKTHELPKRKYEKLKEFDTDGEANSSHNVDDSDADSPELLIKKRKRKLSAMEKNNYLLNKNSNKFNKLDNHFPGVTRSRQVLPKRKLKNKVNINKNYENDENFSKAFTKFDGVDSEGKSVRMIYLNNYKAITTEDWRLYKKLDIQKFTKRMLRVIHDDNPMLLAYRCQKERPLVLTPQGQHRRREISPLKKETLKRCVREYCKNTLHMNEKSKTDDVVERSKSYVTVAVKTAKNEVLALLAKKKNRNMKINIL